MTQGGRTAGLVAVTALVASTFGGGVPAAVGSATTFSAVADTYTYPQAAGWAPGGQDIMKASSFPAIEATAWVKFAEPKDGAVVTGATSTLQVPVMAASEGVVVDVYTAPTGWSEQDLTHARSKDLDAPIATVSDVGDVVEADVTGHVNPSGPTSFALRSRGTKQTLILGTKEGGAPASLVLSAQSGGGTSEPTVPAGPSRTLFGAAVPPSSGSNWANAVQNADSTFGKLGVIRVFYPSAPLAWPGRAGSIKRPVVVSFKLPFDEINSGKHDTRLRNWFASAPDAYDVYWSLHHEPEDDIERNKFTPTQYQTAWRRVSGLAEQVGNDRLHATLIVMNFTLAKGSGRDFYDYYPGDGVVDVIAVDAYNTAWKSGSYRPAENIVGPVADLAAKHNTGFGIAELGSRDVAGDPNYWQRANWLRDVAAEARARGAEFISYWNAKGSNADYRLLDQPSITAWREAVASSTDR